MMLAKKRPLRYEDGSEKDCVPHRKHTSYGVIVAVKKSAPSVKKSQ